jgi:hypothetical protein
MNRREIPAGEVVARSYGVRLAWGDPSHYRPEEKLPCRHGDGPTVMRDDHDQPCHLDCGETELAAERFGDCSPRSLAQELTGHPAEVRR